MKPNIIVTTVDMDRLESMIDAMHPISDTTAALLDELQRADVVEPHEIPPDVVTMDSVVRFTIGAGKEELRRRLVYPHAATDSSTISVLSPVGSALLGLSAGSSIEWPGPTGERLVVCILDVVHQPEAAEASQ